MTDTHERQVRALSEALSEACQDRLVAPASPLSLVPPASVTVPAPVRCLAALEDHAGTRWLVVENLERREPTSQLILSVRPGRYFIDTLDVDSGRWLSRESAAGPTLVVGLVCPGSRAVVMIRPIER